MSCVGVPDKKDPEGDGEGPREGDDKSWSAAEFQKRRGTFENVEAEELSEEDSNPARARR